MVVVGHEATRTGAPLTLLRLLEWLRDNAECDISLLLLDGGPLVPDYAAVCPTNVVRRSFTSKVLLLLSLLASQLPPLRGVASTIDRLRVERRLSPGRRLLRSADIVYVNTVVSALALLDLKQLEARAKTVVHIHEMFSNLDGSTLKRRERDHESLAEVLRRILDRADVTLVVSEAARADLLQAADMDPVAEALHFPIVPPCILWRASAAHIDSRAVLREELGIPSVAAVVMGSGEMYFEKGTDLFVMLAFELGKIVHDAVHFVWVGGWHKESYSIYKSKLEREVAKAGLDTFHFVPTVAEPIGYYAMADVFALTSREDSFPLVAIEAASVGTPVVCFDSVGTAEFLGEHPELVVRHLDVPAFAQTVAGLLGDRDRRRAVGASLAARSADFSIEALGPRYWDLFEGVMYGRGMDPLD